MSFLDRGGRKRLPKFKLSAKFRAMYGPRKCPNSRGNGRVQFSNRRKYMPNGRETAVPLFKNPCVQSSNGRKFMPNSRGNGRSIVQKAGVHSLIDRVCCRFSRVRWVKNNLTAVRPIAKQPRSSLVA